MCYNDLIAMWQDIPYRLGGRDRRGVDCVGIAYAIFGEAGIRLPGNRIPKTNVSDLLKLLRGEFAVVRGALEAYDFLLLRLSAGAVLHCGIYAGDDKFLHVMGFGGVKTETMSKWTPQLIKAYRYRGMTCQLQ